MDKIQQQFMSLEFGIIPSWKQLKDLQAAAIQYHHLSNNLLYIYVQRLPIKSERFEFCIFKTDTGEFVHRKDLEDYIERKFKGK